MKKNRDRPTYSHWDLLMASATEPIPKSKQRHHLLKMYEGLRSLEQAEAPTFHDWIACSDAVNMMETLTEMGACLDASGLLNDAVKALAELTKSAVPDIVNMAYNESTIAFGPNYIIPKPLDPRLLAKYGKATPEALAESALWEASLFEEHGFSDLKISVKHHDPVTMVNAYRILAAKCDYPLHLGVTEAGPAFQATIKSATAFGILLAEGIGDTIRVSMSAPPVEEVKVGISILESLNLRQRKLEIVSCPSCGRAQVDVYTLAEKVQAGLEGMTVPLRVAVMGCVVNGPGEAREADLGVASGNGKGQIFVKGQVIKTVPEAMIVETLIEEAMRLAEEMEAAGVLSGEPSVTVK